MKGLLTQEEHEFLVHELGFKKVKCRCPVCYTEHYIRENIRKQIHKKIIEAQTTAKNDIILLKIQKPLIELYDELSDGDRQVKRFHKSPDCMISPALPNNKEVWRGKR